MALGNGSFFSHGIAFGATLSGQQIVPVMPSKATDAMRFLLIVDSDGNAITPEIVPASVGIDVGEGRIGGIKYTLPTVASQAVLNPDVDTVPKRGANAELYARTFCGNVRVSGLSGAGRVDILSESNIILASFSRPAGQTTIGFFGQTGSTRTSVSASSGTLAADLLQALHDLGLVNKTA